MIYDPKIMKSLSINGLLCSVIDLVRKVNQPRLLVRKLGVLRACAIIDRDGGTWPPNSVGFILGRIYWAGDEGDYSRL